LEIPDFLNQRNPKNRRKVLREKELVKKNEVALLKKIVDIAEEVRNLEKEIELHQKNTKKDHDRDLLIKNNIENVMRDLKEQVFWILKNKVEEIIIDLITKKIKIKENNSRITIENLENKESKENRENKENKEKESKENKENKGNKENKENRGKERLRKRN